MKPAPRCPEAWPALIGAMLHAVWLVDGASRRIVAANRAAGALHGVSAAALVGIDAAQLAATPEDVAFWQEAAEGAVGPIESETRLRRLAGGMLPVLRRVSCIDAGAGQCFYVVAAHDRSEQQRVEAELETAAAELRATLESTADGIMVTDLAGRIRNFNRRFATLWNVPDDLLTQHDDDAVFDWMRRGVVDPGAYMRRLSAIDADADHGALREPARDVVHLHCGTVLERVSLPQCAGGRAIGRVVSFRDITDRLESQRRIDVLAHTDALTGLPNRRALDARIEATLAAANVAGPPFALLFLNLDHFKRVNETFGHAFGDRVMVGVAERIQACLRPGDMAARVGGDEFVVLLHHVDAAAAQAAARHVSEEVQKPFAEAGMNFTVTASIGIAAHPADGADVDTLVRACDAAMHDVKLAGRDGLRLYRPEMASPSPSPAARSRLRLDHAMRLALANGRFVLHYQPKVDLADGAVVGAEALLRWRDPELGNVAPDDFIPVAEESGFIVALGGWALERAVHQAAVWQRAGRDLPVSVNVSALQFQQAGFAGDVAAALRESGLAPGRLELELTESILIPNADAALQRLHALAALGVRLSIDDFGTGYSSLAYLKRLPIAGIKIDRSFIAGLPGGASDLGIVEAIVHLGRALHLETIAEGVETEAQRELLRRCGCDVMQGFLFAPALEPAAFEARLASAAMAATTATAARAQPGLRLLA